jgi:transposase-like protein
MYEIVTKYYDQFCCNNVELIIELELVDTYGGDYTYRDTYICKSCKQVFYSYYGSRFEGITRELDEEKVKYILSSYGVD